MDDAAQLAESLKARCPRKELRELFRCLLPVSVQPKVVALRLERSPP